MAAEGPDFQTGKRAIFKYVPGHSPEWLEERNGQTVTILDIEGEIAPYEIRFDGEPKETEHVDKEELEPIEE